MKKWKEYKLGDIADIQTGPFGSQLHQRDYVPIGTPCIMPTNIGGRLNIDTTNIAHVKEDDVVRLQRHCVKEGDIIYSRRGDIEKCAYIFPENEGWLCGTGCLRIRIKSDSMLARFVAYQLSTQECKKWIVGNAVGSTMLNLNSSILKELPLLAPIRSEQEKIVSVLKSLDDKIEVNRRINDNLEQQAQALFKSWFVDFEPFKDQPFEESELGMIPKGWKVYSMDELVKVIGGYSYKGSELHDSNIAMATIKNFNRNGGFKTDGFKEIIPSPKAKPDQYLSKYDILIAHTDLTQNADIIGNPALLLNYGDYERIIMSMDLVKVISKIDSITYGLLYSIFADSRFKSHALGYVNGTTVLHLSKKSVPEYKIALPCELTTVNQYGLILNSIFEKESFVIDESRRLLELRDTLLPRLMSGELIIAQ